MRARKTEDRFARINNVIQSDKSVMSDACKALVLQDFSEKFNEYFDLIGLPRMELTRQNGTYAVCVTFEAERIKKFNVLK
ncbi:MAG: hypothetical protein IJX87_05400 [Clostridia bacterium]|nr:hypothetical protein [Clostridia bacterium]